MHAVIWMYRKNMVLTEGSHIQKDIYSMISLLLHIQHRRIQRERKQYWVVDRKNGEWGSDGMQTGIPLH